MTDGQFTSLKLNGQQQTLFKALAVKHQILSNIYIGILITMDHISNPDRLPLAAHGVRELMEKIPAFLDVSITAQAETLKTKVRELEDCWIGTVKSSQCYSGQGWHGQIDKSLSKLLERLQSFFKWFVEHHPRRKAEIASALRTLDGSGRILPTPLEELNVKTWDKIRDFFQAISHHLKTTDETEFRQWLDALERFLLDRLCPRTFSDIEAIDSIIREGESDG